MKASLRWLRHLTHGVDLDVEGVVQRLAARGAPVEWTSYLGEGLDDVLVARVREVSRHPGADRLSLCTVDSGQAALHRVVCGASNVRAGRLYPFAPIGAKLPGGVTIGRAKIRGEVSEGMLCSAKELGLGTDQDGLLELPEGPEPGARLVDAMALVDWQLEVEVTANRGDLLCHVGLARELVDEGDAGLELPPFPGAAPVTVEWVRHSSAAVAGGVTVRVEAPDLCSRYLGAVVRGVRVGPSPEWLQARLRAAGARPVNNVVDATNYVLLELGQPLHAFDLAKLSGPAIVVRRARLEERAFRTLDGQDRHITADMLMICDQGSPVAIAGVMGGEASAISGSTTDILLECALFDPKSIRKTRRALGMSTDASYRFERGVDPSGLELSAMRALELIASVTGGSPEPFGGDCSPAPWAPRSVTLRLDRVARVLGVRFTQASVRALLQPLGFAFESGPPGEGEPGELQVLIPGYRSYDVKREIDLIEEIARAHGYDNFPEALAPYRPGTVPDHPFFRLEEDVRRALVARGLHEAQTPSFVPAGEGDLRVRNPVSQGEAFLRRDLVPSLVRRVEHNLARGQREVRLFEIATSFRAAAEGERPHESPHLAVVLTGLTVPLHWSGEGRDWDLWGIKGLLEDLLDQVHPGAVLEPAGPGELRTRPGEGFVVRETRGDVLGWGGQLPSGAVDAPAWAAPVWAIELELPGVPGARPRVTHQPLPSFPAVERDPALLVPDGVPSARVVGAIRTWGGEHLEDVEVFDLYRGAGVPEGTRSLAYRLRFQSAARTLTDDEVDRALAVVAERLERDLGARVRGFSSGFSPGFE